jgi:hypothetical protein
MLQMLTARGKSSDSKATTINKQLTAKYPA